MRKDIIIIDDDRDLCTLLQESLLQENICADISCNGFDGIKSVKDKEYQLVVLDVMMPGISGFEVLERIRDMSNVPILMLTAKDDSTSKVKGFVDCLRSGCLYSSTQYPLLLHTSPHLHPYRFFVIPYRLLD